MDWATGLVAGGLGLLGSSQARSAAKDAAAAQLEAAKIAADAAAFKPYSVTTGFGSSYFNPETQTAGYTLDPALEAWRDQMMGMGAQALPTSMDTSANAQQYYNEIQGMMAPQRQAENLQMQQDLFGSGRLGILAWYSQMSLVLIKHVHRLIRLLLSKLVHRHRLNLIRLLLVVLDCSRLVWVLSRWV
jgi:hypothetical protein